MKRNILWMRKTLLSTLIALVFTTAIVLAGKSSSIPTINQANPTTTVYLDPPTINGTAIGVNNTITVNLMVHDAHYFYGWQAGLSFNATLLQCTAFKQGEFLSAASPEGTSWYPAPIDNTKGVVTAHGCTILGDYLATGDGRLAYATFKVKTLGVSDIHLNDVKAIDYNLNMVPINIIDVYTVVLDTTPHKVVTVSNLTGATKEYVSGFYAYDHNLALKEISFKVAGPHTITHAGGVLVISGSFSNVTIPRTLLPPPEPPREWAVIINGIAVNIEDIIKSENATHTSIYFTFPSGKNDVQITTRFSSSTISIALDKESISLGESVTISGAIDPVKPDVTVTIYNRTKGDVEWDTLATVKTDSNSEYTYTWEPRKKGTYEVRASWEGDEETLRRDSNVLTLKVKGKPSIPLEVMAVVAVVIILIVAIVVYFARFRKTK